MGTRIRTPRIITQKTEDKREAAVKTTAEEPQNESRPRKRITEVRSENKDS